jgi:hypothetical protein
MSELLQFIIVAAFGAFCFGCGYLTAFVVTRNKWRDEMSLADSVNPRKIRRVGNPLRASVANIML